jgi:hypothetical protein
LDKNDKPVSDDEPAARSCFHCTVALRGVFDIHRALGERTCASTHDSEGGGGLNPAETDRPQGE